MHELVAVGLPAAFAVRLLTIAATMLLARRAQACRWTSMLGSLVASMLTMTVALTVITSGQPVAGLLAPHVASGLVFDYAVTPLSAWFLMVLGLIGIPIAVYSVAYFAHAVAAPRTALVGSAFNVLLGSVEAVFVANGIITFLCAWEVMTLATAALVATEHQERASRGAAFLYLVMSHIGTGCLVVGFLALAAQTGSLAFLTCCRATWCQAHCATVCLCSSSWGLASRRVSSRCTCGCPRRIRRRQAVSPR